MENAVMRERFSPRKLGYLLRKRNMNVLRLHELFIRDGASISAALLYKWVNGESQPRANHLADLAFHLRCHKDDFFDEGGTVQ
jgi:hypothetical protein